MRKVPELGRKDKEKNREVAVEEEDGTCLFFQQQLEKVSCDTSPGLKSTHFVHALKSAVIRFVFRTIVAAPMTHIQNFTDI